MGLNRHTSQRWEMDWRQDHLPELSETLGAVESIDNTKAAITQPPIGRKNRQRKVSSSGNVRSRITCHNGCTSRQHLHTSWVVVVEVWVGDGGEMELEKQFEKKKKKKEIKKDTAQTQPLFSLSYTVTVLSIRRIITKTGANVRGPLSERLPMVDSCKIWDAIPSWFRAVVDEC